MFFNVSPNDLKGLGTRNLGSTNKRLHLRRNPPGLHDATGLPGGGSGLVGGGSEGNGAGEAQIRQRKLIGMLDGGDDSGGSGNEERRFAGDEGGDESHGRN